MNEFLITRERVREHPPVDVSYLHADTEKTCSPQSLIHLSLAWKLSPTTALTANYLLIVVDDDIPSQLFLIDSASECASSRDKEESED
jgi:hypothetical protein